MLAGRYADSRVRELDPRVSVDRIDNTVEARRGAARLVYLSGGTIPDRGYFHLRHQESMAKLGELDEEFVWERSLGDTFSLGAQSWRINRITHNDVLVTPAYKSARDGALLAGGGAQPRLLPLRSRSPASSSGRGVPRGRRDRGARRACWRPSTAWSPRPPSSSSICSSASARHRAAAAAPSPPADRAPGRSGVRRRARRVIFHTALGRPRQPAAGDGPEGRLAAQVRRAARRSRARTTA